jgi:dTDP-4-amino-4,6-dideoxygalactose transaminase
VTVAAVEVPFLDLGRTHARLREEFVEAFERVLGSSAFVLGEEVAAFEADFAAYCGADRCAGVASGTAALVLALQAAGVGPGDEVIVPGHTFIASALGVIHAGATPVFCDVEPGTGLIDAESAEAAISDRTAAIIAVHLYGQVCDMHALRQLADRRGLLLVEDAAQAHGATLDGDRAGSLGDLACFSFYPSKNLGALGDGGAIIAADEAIDARIRRLRNLGQERKGEHVELGHNERLDGLQAALLRVKLPHLDGWNASRRHSASQLRRLLPEALRPVEERLATPSTHHVFAVRVSDRDAVAEDLRTEGIQTGVHYFPAAHEHAPCAVGISDRVELAESEAWAREELSLPMFPEMTEDEIDLVVGACREVVGDS